MNETLAIADVVADSRFPPADTRLRLGVHLDELDRDLFEFVSDNFECLQDHFARYEYTLVKSPDGFVYLVPRVESVRHRQMTPAEMLVGQVLALFYLDPSTAAGAGLVTREQVLELASSLVGEERLLEALNPRRRKRDLKVEQAAVREEVDRALRSLASLGFLSQQDEIKTVRLRAAVLRFAIPARSGVSPAEALGAAIREGEIASPEDVDEGSDEDGT